MIIMDNINSLKLKFESKEIDSFFDCLADILLKVSGGNLYTYNGFKKYFSKVMICRYLSMKSTLMDYAEYLNKVQYNLSNEQFYILVYNLIPQQKTGYIKYIKKNKSESKGNKNNTTDCSNANSTTLSIFDL